MYLVIHKKSGKQLHLF